MDKETKKTIAVISILIAVIVVVFLLMSGFELIGFEIHKGIKLN